MFRRIAFFLVFSVFSAALHAAQPKEALLIANGKYSHFAGLAHPSPDAAKLSAALEQLGFRVRVVRDGNREQMLDAISEFERGLRNTGAIAFFHYGGHGVQVDGKNYLLPADADIPDERRVATRAVALDEVMTAMDAAAARASIIVIDACRDNPLPGGSGRNLARGLSVVGIKPKNSIVIYAAEAGSKALDGLFTPILAMALQQKGRTIDQVMKSVRSEVYAKSSGQQTPGEYNQLFEELFLAAEAGDTVHSPQESYIKSIPVILKSPEQIEEEHLKRITSLANASDKDFRNGNYHISLAKIQEVEKLLPNDPGVLIRIGRLQEKTGDIVAAGETYKKVLACNNLSFELRTQTQSKLNELILSNKKHDANALEIESSHQKSSPSKLSESDLQEREKNRTEAHHNNTSISIMKKKSTSVGNSSNDCLSALPDDLRDRVIDMASSDNGNPDPQSWYVTVKLPGNSSSLRYLQINNGKVVSNEGFSIFANIFYSRTPLTLGNVIFHSRDVYEIASRQAILSGFTISNATFLLKNKGKIPEPTWIVWCYNDNKYLGAIEIRARDGQILASKGKFK